MDGGEGILKIIFVDIVSKNMDGSEGILKIIFVYM